MDILENILTLPATYVLILYLILLPVSRCCISYGAKLGTDMKYAFVGYNLFCLIINFFCTLIGFEIRGYETLELVELKEDELFVYYDYSKLLEMLDGMFIMFFLNKYKIHLFPIFADIPMFLLADYAFNFAQFQPFYGVIFWDSIFQTVIHIYYCIFVIINFEDHLKEFAGFAVTILQLLKYAVLIVFLLIGYEKYEYSGYAISVSVVILISTTVYYLMVSHIYNEILYESEKFKRNQKQPNSVKIF